MNNANQQPDMSFIEILGLSYEENKLIQSLKDINKQLSRQNLEYKSQQINMLNKVTQYQMKISDLNLQLKESHQTINQLSKQCINLSQNMMKIIQEKQQKSIKQQNISRQNMDNEVEIMSTRTQPQNTKIRLVEIEIIEGKKQEDLQQKMKKNTRKLIKISSENKNLKENCEQYKKNQQQFERTISLFNLKLSELKHENLKLYLQLQKKNKKQVQNIDNS